MIHDDRAFEVLLKIQAELSHTKALLDTHIPLMTTRLEANEKRIDHVEERAETCIRRVTYFATVGTFVVSACVWLLDRADIIQRVWKAL